MPFEKARAFVHKLKLSTRSEWNKYCRGEIPGKPHKPDDIPASPRVVYLDKGWKSFGDWLGTGTIAPSNRVFWSFKKARAFVRKLKLKNESEWRSYTKGQLSGKTPMPTTIPTHPDRTYKTKGWKSFGDWLGTSTIAPKDRVYWPFQQAREYVHKLRLKSSAEWHRYCCLLYTSPSPRDRTRSRMPSSA